jgi:2-oxoglutarate dehydrogenase E2 component (dihydrolipoamide succinyltransferase)
MIAIKVPPLGESIVEATISRWAKQPGDPVAAGDTLVELETDKVTVEVPALRAGVLRTHAKREGDVVVVDELLGELDESAQAAAVAPPPASPVAPAIARVSTPAPAAAAPAAVAGMPARAVRASPSAQRVATAAGVDLAAVAGTGRGGVISKPDVLEHLARIQAAPAAATPVPRTPPAPGTRETREPMSTRRRRIAEHLLLAQHATAHLTTFNEIDMTAVTAVRDRLRERVEKEHGVRLSFMPFFIKAACQALARYPVVNAQIDGDTVIYKHYVHMGIAVASDQGLVVPVIRDADGRGLVDVAREVSAVAGRARAGKLTIDDLTGGTFTITNGGVFGSLVSTPILNYPQVGILGLHAIQDRPIAERGQVVIRPMMYVALSYDHRIVDGQQAVLFLVRIKELLEDPASMLVD